MDGVNPGTPTRRRLVVAALVGTLVALKAGPSAVPGLLAASPSIPIKEEVPTRTFVLGAVAAAAALGAVVLMSWSRSRKNARLPS